MAELSGTLIIVQDRPKHWCLKIFFTSFLLSYISLGWALRLQLHAVHNENYKNKNIGTQIVFTFFKYYL